MSTFRAFWPIVDDTVPPIDLIREAALELPRLTAQAHAVINGPGRWAIAPSCKVPGSGRVTPTVLLYEAPATQGRAPYPDSRNEVA